MSNPFQLEKKEAFLQQEPSVTTRHFNVYDASTTEGLAVHLQSPALKRRYWQERYAENFKRLRTLEKHALEIKSFLSHYQCHHLLAYFEQELEHHQQLERLHSHLHQQEYKPLGQGEQVFLNLCFLVKHQLRKIMEYLKALNLFKKKRSFFNTGHEAMRTLQQWVHFLVMHHKEKGLPSACLEELYSLKF